MYCWIILGLLPNRLMIKLYLPYIKKGISFKYVKKISVLKKNH
jgi:hypothetical protein